MPVNYCKMVTVTTEDQLGSHEMRNAVGAMWPFLSDHERKLVYELDMADESEDRFGPVFVPYTFVLDSDRTIYKVYMGWWYVGSCAWTSAPSCPVAPIGSTPRIGKQGGWDSVARHASR